MNKGDCVVVSIGGGFLGIRLIDADSIGNSEGTLELVRDETGDEHGAARLKLLHGQGRFGDVHDLRESFLVVASDSDPTDSLMKAELKSGVDGDRWAVRGTVGGMTLEVARSVSDRRKILEQMVDGKPAERAVLEVDGRDLTGVLTGP